MRSWGVVPFGFEFLFAAALALATAGRANALPSWGKFVQFSAAEVATGDLDTAVKHVADKSGFPLLPKHFKTYEDRQLATSRFVMYAQQAGNLPVRSASIRMWLDEKTGKVIRGEAFVANPPAALPAMVNLSQADTIRAVDRFLSRTQIGDRAHRKVDWRDYYEDGHIVRVIRVLGAHGKHEIEMGLSNGAILRHRFDEFPKADAVSSVPAKLYPVYEEVEGTGEVLPLVDTKLEHLNAEVSNADADPFAPLRRRKWLESKYDPLFGTTAAGQALGYWAIPYVRSLADTLIATTPKKTNAYKNGVVLEGKYVTVSLHPLAPKKFPLSFTPSFSTNLKPEWTQVAGGGYEMIPYAGLRGKAIASEADATSRPARRLADHDPKSYIEDGFDELQVYWSVDRFMSSLGAMGFLDPDLSTRPFHAILYDPDITYRDNAFYTDDTINFTTYSAGHANFARDNTTIWHELGHGVMDRVMGDVLKLDDTGGLSEGMADFLALLVVEKSTDGVAFPGKDALRIFNRTGFFLTNEVHDDGEAYGGSMGDFLTLAIGQFGRAGVAKVADLTIEAMRFSRNHPGLTAEDWFNRLLFADTRPSALRQAGELAPLLKQALASRNFPLAGQTAAKFTLKNGDNEVVSGGAGTRERPIQVSLKATETEKVKLSVKVESGTAYAYQFPITVEVGLRGGPLQGGIQWANEDTAPFRKVIANETEEVSFDLAVKGVCDLVNRPDGSCVDFAYVKIVEAAGGEPVAKKRFYYQVKPQ